MPVSVTKEALKNSAVNSKDKTSANESKSMSAFFPVYTRSYTFIGFL